MFVKFVKNIEIYKFYNIHVAVLLLAFLYGTFFKQRQLLHRAHLRLILIRRNRKYLSFGVAILALLAIFVIWCVFCYFPSHSFSASELLVHVLHAFECDQII